MLATCSGQRKYELALDTDSDSDSDSDSDGPDTESSHKAGAFSTSPTSSASTDTIDNSIRLWSVPGAFAWYVDGQRWIEPGTSTAGEEHAAVGNDVSMSVVVETTESLPVSELDAVGGHLWPQK